MKRIVVATDGSSGSQAAVTQAIELAKATGARVTFVTVLHGVGRSSDPVSGEPLSASGTERNAAQVAAATARDGGADADFQFLDGDPADAVVDFASAERADVIVVGSRGLGAVRSLVLGSVSRRIVDHAQCPVLVVK
jgi:nucleotide-binding universal stress UspA family protein